MESFLNGVASNVALAGALALVVFSLTRVWRSPQLAHALWLLVLIKLLAPHLFNVPLYDAWSSPKRAVRAGLSDGPGNPRGADVPERARVPTSWSQKRHPEGSEPVGVSTDLPPRPVEPTQWSTSGVPSRAIAVARVADFLGANWRMALCFIWAVGVLMCMALVARRLNRFRTLVALAVDAKGALVEDATAFARQLNLRTCPRIRVLDAHIPPLVYAAWPRPFLLFPERLLDTLDREQLQAVLVHELAHVRRKDYLVRWFEILVRGLFWWNPLVWWVSRQLRQAEEECCDAWVVWALPDSQKSYGKALLQTVEFLADRPVVPIAGTAFGGSHVKRRIEMIVKRKLNRKMSRGALLVAILFAVCVLPVAAQKRPDTDAGNRGLADREPAQNTATHPPKVAESRDLDARIERLERLVQELTQTVKGAAADSTMPRDVAVVDTERKPIHPRRFVYYPSTFRASENDQEKQLKATLLALEKEYWEAAGKGDWKVAEKLLADDFFGGYANSSGSGREGKALVIAAVTRRRYSDSTMRNAQVRRISKDTAIVTYVYNCKVEEAGQVWTYRNHQTTRVWTQRDGQWLLIFSEDFILPGGE
jgi:beta-lactamase regulating signal transducer with metallopeptidase domain